MSKSSKWVLPVLIGAGLLLFSKGKQFAEDFVQAIKFVFKGIGFKNITFTTTTLVLNFELQNPNSLPVPVQGISGDLLFKEQIIGTFTQTEGFTLSANSVLDLDVDIKLNNLQLGSTLFNLIQTLKQGGSLNSLVGKGLKINGLINLGITQIPFTYEI